MSFSKSEIALAEGARAISAFWKTQSCKLISNWKKKSGECNFGFWKTHSCKLIPNWTQNEFIRRTSQVRVTSRVRAKFQFFFLLFFLFLFMSWWLSLWLVLPQWRLFGILQTFSFPVRRDREISFAGSSILTEIIPIPFYDFREWFTLVLLRNEAEATVRCFLRHFNLKLAQTKMLSWNSWVVSIQHKQK